MWHSHVIDHLERLKLEGWEFEEAWTEALDLYPPFAMDSGPSNGRLFRGEEDDEPLVDFLRRACEAAWNNEQRVLARLGSLRDLIGGDESSGARKSGGSKLARNRLVA